MTQMTRKELLAHFDEQERADREAYDRHEEEVLAKRGISIVNPLTLFGFGRSK